MARIGVNALYLIPGGVGGTEIYLRELLKALAEIDDVKPRAAVAIRAGNQTIGTIWVIHDEELEEESQHALAEAANPSLAADSSTEPRPSRTVRSISARSRRSTSRAARAWIMCGTAERIPIT